MATTCRERHRGDGGDVEEVEKRLVFESTEGVQVIQSFREMGIKKDLHRGLYTYGVERASAIQQCAILPILQGRDAIAQAQSITGKTSIIALAICQILNTSTRGTQALIWSPTREMALQSDKVIQAIGGEYIKFKSDARVA